MNPLRRWCIPLLVFAAGTSAGGESVDLTGLWKDRPGGRVAYRPRQLGAPHDWAGDATPLSPPQSPISQPPSGPPNDWRDYPDLNHGSAAAGERFPYNCPPNGALWPVYGTDTYTSDTSVCPAAVHAGLITVASGGSV